MVNYFLPTQVNTFSVLVFRKITVLVIFLVSLLISGVKAQTNNLHPAPVPNFDAIGLCPGDSTFFINTTLMGRFYTWTILNDNDDTLLKSTNDNISFYFNSTGVYTVTLIADNGHPSQLTRKVIVDSVPHADFSFWICYNQFNNLSSCADEFTWIFPDGSVSNLRSPAYKFDKAGTYPITLISKKAGKQDSRTKQISIDKYQLGFPSPKFTYAQVGTSLTFIITALDSNAVSYYWSFGDGTYDDTIGYKITHTFDPDLELSISLFVENNCGMDSDYQKIILPNINESNFLIFNTKVYPNPTHGQLNLSISNLSDKQEIFIKLINANGQRVYDERLLNSTSSYNWQFNTHHLPKGLYLLQLNLNNGVLNKKILIL